jgi:hypothetical protein
LSHSIGSAFDFTCQSQKPAISSFVRPRASRRRSPALR